MVQDLLFHILTLIQIVGIKHGFNYTAIYTPVRNSYCVSMWIYYLDLPLPSAGMHAVSSSSLTMGTLEMELEA